MTIEIPNCCTPLAYIYRAGNLKTLLDINKIINPGNVNKINRIMIEKIRNKHINNIRKAIKHKSHLTKSCK